MRSIAALAILVVAAALPALAQEQEPPARVGRVSYVSGNLAFHMASEKDWSAAGVNYPVAAGGSFWTDPQARAEIRIGPSTIDLAGGTEVDVTNLNDRVSQISVPQGRLYLYLRQLDAGQSFEIDLPQGAVWLLQPGAYDIDAGTADQPARVAVFSGGARFVGGGADIGINAGDAVGLSGSSPVAAETGHAAPDAFVAWCRARDTSQKRPAATAYVSSQMTGAADLDRYGAWQSNPQYGEVWYPSQVQAGWAPYRDGHWISVPPWGWTWVDQEPWGFAPFHYGRWADIGGRWGWVPGQYVPQPVYAPALVAFVGGAAGGFGVSGELGVSGRGEPAVGWFPLAPGEAYWPSYTRNVSYIRNVNITNVKNINTILIRSNGAPPPQAANESFANRRFATVVPQRVFATAAPVAPAAIQVMPAALAKAPVALHPPEIRPVPHPAGVAARGPEHSRPVPVGPGIAPPARPTPAAASGGASGAPGVPPHPPAHAVEPGRPAVPAPTVPATTAAIPPHPGIANTPERGPHAPAAAHPAATPEPGHAPAAPEPAGPHPAAPSTAALPPAHPEGLPPLAHPGGPLPAGRARPGVVEPVPAPAAAAPRREVLPPPGIAPEHRPPAVNQAQPAAPPRPEALPRPQPPAQAQAVHPPAPVAHPAPSVVRPPAPVARPAPAVARPITPAVARPPAPPVVRPIAPAVARPPAPAAVHAPPAVVERPARAAPSPAPMRPHPAPAPQTAHGGGKAGPKEPGPKEKGKEDVKQP